jgi:hypothetical protein
MPFVRFETLPPVQFKGAQIGVRHFQADGG